MDVIAYGRNGILPQPNRPMVVFNGVPYRRAVVEASLFPKVGLGNRVTEDWLDKAGISGEFGMTYNGRIEWIYGHHLTGYWSLRPSGRPIYTYCGVQSGYRIEMFQDAQNRRKL